MSERAVLDSSALARFAAAIRAGTGARREPEWLSSRRAAAARRFESRGLPRPDDEAWRQTSLASIEGTAFVTAGDADAGALVAWPLADLPGPRLVFVNGRPVRALWRRDGLADRVTASSISERFDDPAVASHLGTTASIDDHPFGALNTALFEDGAFVEIPEGVELPQPIVLVHLVAGGAHPVASHPRTLIVSGPGSRATIVELFAGGGEYLHNAVAEIVAGTNARLDHVRVQADAIDAHHIGLVQGVQGRDSRLVSHNISFGGRLARHDVGSRLAGEGADCQLFGVAVAGGAQHVDNHTTLDHAVPHTGSREMYKTVLGGKARAVFNGRIIVRKGAQKTDAKQSNRNLLLTGEALVHTRPQLEIYADDVKCTHGATVGQLDAEALFYLRSRAIGIDASRSLLLRAFVGEATSTIEVPSLRERLDAEILARLPMSER